jgi:hypothetical protein
MGAAREADEKVWRIYWDKLAAGQTAVAPNPQKDGSFLGQGVKLVEGKIEYDQFGNILNYDKLKFAPNDNKTFLQDYISRFYNSGEGNLMSRTFSKLREVTFTYVLPKRLFEGEKSLIRGASVSLVGRNLLYFAEKNDIDLEQYIGGGQSGLQTPTTKRYGINLNVTF